MRIEHTTFRSSTWGVAPIPGQPGHWHTGYVGYNWRTEWTPANHMEIGRNVVITGDFRIESMSRGRSAANFSGRFRDHDAIEYEFGMKGSLALMQLLQSGKFLISGGFITGTWTFAKQGESIFLQPAVKP